MNKKTILAVSVVSGIGVFALIKKNQFDKISDNLTFAIRDVRNFKIHSGRLLIDLSLTIGNPTNEVLNINTGALKMESLRVYEKDTKKQLAGSNLRLSKFNLDAFGTYDLPTINLGIPLMTGAMLMLNQLKNNKVEFMDRLYFEIDLKFYNFKKTITI
ncbi:hypothetical protein [Tenacibaculum dicentrarchi]|uniref:hypothetical protein n=1 Tax=Tenacibaculum dicentrarchi TaxID=669041 RepID=UPI000C795D78|nr:conserved hypothetical protein [Tenacibaculum dicentrarchi]